MASQSLNAPITIGGGMPNPLFVVCDDVWTVDNVECAYIDIASFADWDEANEYAFFHCGPNAFIDRVEYCVHGMSAWLCADPINHYPRGY